MSVLLLGAFVWGCFSEPATVDPIAAEGSDDGEADSGGVGGAGDDTADSITSGPDGDDGNDDNDDNDDGTQGPEDGPDDDSDDASDADGNPTFDVVFDFHLHACDETTERFGYNAGSLDVGAFACGAPGPLGGVEQLEDVPLASGGTGERVVVMSVTPFSESQVSLDTLEPVALSTTGGPLFVGRIDCVAGSEGTLLWQLNYTGPQGQDLEPAASGTVTCGEPMIDLNVPLFNDVDRRVGFVLLNESNEPAAVALIGPAIVDPAS